jgi:hypothetical protein
MITAMTTTAFDWRSFLTRWSEEWADAHDPGESLSEGDEEAQRTRWLGFVPASAEQLAALEESLGRELPTSLRAFYQVSNGWRHAGGFVYLLAGTTQACWFEDSVGFAEVYQEDLHEDSTPQEVLLAGMWTRALQLDVESDITHVLLDPGDIAEDGEWAVYYYRGWAGEAPQRYASFEEFMAAMYRSFHQLQTNRGTRSGREFANATTRALDAAVEDARLAALRGQYTHAETVLADALDYGRPRARGLRDQIRRMQGHTYMVTFDQLPFDPVYAPELLPLLAASHVANRHDDASWELTLRPATEAMRQAGRDLLQQMKPIRTWNRLPGQSSVTSHRIPRSDRK